MGLETIALVATLGSAAIGAVGAIQQGRAASQAAGYNAEVAANNAKIATQNAGFAAAEGEANAAASAAKTRAKIGATLAGQGASGIDVNSGSSVDVRESESKLGMLDAMTIRSNAARQAYGFQTQAVGDQAQSQLYKSQQKSDQLGGYLNAGATVLGGVGSGLSNYNKFLSNGSVTGDLTGVNTTGTGVGTVSGDWE